MDKIKEMIKEGYKMDSSLIGAHLKKNKCLYHD